MQTQSNTHSLLPGFQVTVFGTRVDISSAVDVIARIQRPDKSVVERTGHPVSSTRVELALHPDDLGLSGSYLGEVELTLDGERMTFSPAFELLRVGSLL